jgi:hypothetical protein
VSGGEYNTIVGDYGTIPGGLSNSVVGFYSLAAGRQAKANHQGSFVWADSDSSDFASTANDQFNIRARGGVRISDNTPNFSFGSTTRQMLMLWGGVYGVGVQSSTLYFRTGNGPDDGFAWYQSGVHSDDQFDAGTGGTQLMRLDRFGLVVNGTFINASDRNSKENFEPVDSREVLDKVAALPLSKWNYKLDGSSRHLGPMAQDFYAAFGVGPDDKHIATVDADGVALAAIQGLNQKLTEELKHRDAENAELKQRLEALEKIIRHQKSK